MKEQFYYDMARHELKEQKIKDMKVDDGAVADYADLTVTDDDYAEEERSRFEKFLKQRKDDKEIGLKYYNDEQALREKQGYDDDYLGVAKEELDHLAEEQERITDLLKKELPKTERARREMFDAKQQAHMDQLDEVLAEIEMVDMDNTNYDLESMKLDMQEIENIYGAEQNVKD